jgi:Domain of unknown function (DUF4136)
MRASRPRQGLALVALLLLGGCASAPPQPESVLDRSVDFDSFRTFGWAPAQGVSGADQPLMMLDQNIRSAIAAEMRRRGYTETAEDPDLRFIYETTAENKVESKPVRVGIGVGSWGGGFGGSVNVGSPSVSNYREGTLVIHAIDTERNAEVWQGRISSKLTEGSTETAAVTSAVAAAMRDFPARSGQ